MTRRALAEENHENATAARGGHIALTHQRPQILYVDLANTFWAVCATDFTALLLAH